jgi:hypothetical protein
MKKSTRMTLLTLVALTILLVSTAAPAMGAGLTLLNVTVKGTRGLILTFDAGGEYSGAMNGTAAVGWKTYPMYCAKGSAGKLICFVGSGIFRHSGKTALVSLGGEKFSVGIPSRPHKHSDDFLCSEDPYDPNC